MGDTSSGHDLVILGGGVGGYTAALRAGTWGADVVLVERAELGGTCLNRGCIPAKTLIEAAARFRSATEISGPARDLAGMIARKNEVVSALRKGVEGLLKKRKVEVVAGSGTLEDSRTVRVELAGGGTRTLRGRHVILATGSRPSGIPGLEADGAKVLDSDHILDATELGDRLVIVGGGILGCEFAYIYSALGYSVTVVEMLERLAPTFSPEASRELERALKKLGASVRTGARIESADVGETVRLGLEGGDSLEADTALLAAGRVPVTEGIGLEELGVLGERGFVKADDRGRTGAPGLYAVGDVTGKAMLAHAASHQGLAAVADALGRPAPGPSAIPWAAYTHPEVASVGMLDAEAAEAGREVVAGRVPFMALGRARAMGETAGYLKIVADARTHRVLGAEIVGPHATELVHEAALAVRLEATLEDLEETVHAHPTLSEGYAEAAMSALGRSVNL